MEAAWHPGLTLRIRRENTGLTQAQLAGLSGLAVSNISAIENRRRAVGLAVAKKLAEALGRPPSIAHRWAKQHFLEFGAPLNIAQREEAFETLKRRFQSLGMTE